MHALIIVPPEISRAMRGFGLGRDALVGLLNGMRHELENNLSTHQTHRDPIHPDTLFWLALAVWDQGKPRVFRFTVDDARATDRVFLAAAEEI